MAVKCELLLLLVAVLTVYCAHCRTVGKAEVDFSGYCSDATIPAGSSYWQSLNLTLSDIVLNTPNSPGMSFTVKHGRDSVASYGQGICFSTVGGAWPCKDCLGTLVKRALNECYSSVSAVLTLTGKCSVRYQDTPIALSPPPTMAPSPKKM